MALTVNTHITQRHQVGKKPISAAYSINYAEPHMLTSLYIPPSVSYPSTCHSPCLYSSLWLYVMCVTTRTAMLCSS